jgi:hypothetical protein|tara:strand:+ start:1001 stop:1177 length:177 start_codon:yes stop_codon:yes gene_type:complete
MTTEINVFRAEDVEIVRSRSEITQSHFTDIIVSCADGTKLQVEVYSDERLPIRERIEE